MVVTTICGDGRRRAQPLDSLGAEPVRHPQVEHDHVRMLDGHLVNGGLEIGRLADDLQIVRVVEQPPQAPAQTGMVVRKQDTRLPIPGWAVRIAMVDSMRVAHASNVGQAAGPDHRLSAPPTRGEVPNPSR